MLITDIYYFIFGVYNQIFFLLYFSVKEARKAAAMNTGPPVLYLNAGDTYTGTAWFTIYKWKIAAECLNALQPDAVVRNSSLFEPETSQVLFCFVCVIVSMHFIDSVHPSDWLE